ncbi:MAG TPA: hypothetical protein VFD32_22555 [Dehalococcoidia bacterium]|nr:hypothetical protein [Dehalococcoidia bacterium]
MTVLLQPAERIDSGTTPYRPYPTVKRRLPRALAGDVAARRRFVQTARTLRRLRHPHIAAILAVDEQGEVPGYRVEVIDGVPLAVAAQAAGGFDAARVAELLRPICAVLDALHDEGLLCRGLEREALLERGGRVRLRERGIAAPLPDDAAGTEDDIRALGAFAWTLLGGTGVEGASLHGGRPPLPAAVRAAIQMALADDPAARPPTASAFLALFDGSWPLAAPVSGDAVARERRAPVPQPMLVRAAACADPAAEYGWSPLRGIEGSPAAWNGRPPDPAPCTPTAIVAPVPAVAIRPRRRREGWTTNVMAALLWVATIAGAGGAIVHYVGGWGGSHARTGVPAATPDAEAVFPAIPGSARPPTAVPIWRCAGPLGETAC